MIKLHRLNGTEVVLNAELIESIESNPDATINLINGNRFVVKETIDEIRTQIVNYKKRIGLNVLDKEEETSENNKKNQSKD